MWRGWQARSKLAGHRRELSAVNDVGFTLITLFVGFVVILVNDAGGPAWLMAVLGILAILAGRRAVVRIKARRHRPGRGQGPTRDANTRPDQRELDESASRYGGRH